MDRFVRIGVCLCGPEMSPGCPVQWMGRKGKVIRYGGWYLVFQMDAIYLRDGKWAIIPFPVKQIARYRVTT